MNITGTVLIVDNDPPKRRGSDKPGIVEEIRKYLPNVVVERSGDAADAVERAKAKPYDLFIIGSELAFDNISLASVLRGLNGYADTPYIFISNTAAAGKRIKSQFPDVDFFVKPLRVPDFAERIKRFLTLVHTLESLKSQVDTMTMISERYSGEGVDGHREIAT